MDIGWITGGYTLNKVPVYPVIIHGLSVVYEPFVLCLPIVWASPQFIYPKPCTDHTISARNLVVSPCLGYIQGLSTVIIE